MERAPLPPFMQGTATTKVTLAEDAWKSRHSACVSLACPPDSRWRNPAEFLAGRNKIKASLHCKWRRELDNPRVKEFSAFTQQRIAVRFAYEFHNGSGNWPRAYGNENWEFSADGLKHPRIASTAGHPISGTDRLLKRPHSRRPDDFCGFE